MHDVVLPSAAWREATRTAAPKTVGPRALRALAIVACIAAATIVWSLADPSAAVRADPELARLLRGMAVLKGGMVVAAIAILWWRFAYPIAPRVAVVYVACSALMAASAAAIWQLTFLLPAAASFHAGLIVALIIAWRGDGDVPSRAKVFG